MHGKSISHEQFNTHHTVYIYSKNNTYDLWLETIHLTPKGSKE